MIDIPVIIDDRYTSNKRWSTPTILTTGSNFITGRQKKRDKSFFHDTNEIVLFLGQIVFGAKCEPKCIVNGFFVGQCMMSSKWD